MWLQAVPKYTLSSGENAFNGCSLLVIDNYLVVTCFLWFPVMSTNHIHMCTPYMCILVSLASDELQELHQMRDATRLHIAQVMNIKPGVGK